MIRVEQIEVTKPSQSDNQTKCATDQSPLDEDQQDINLSQKSCNTQGREDLNIVKDDEGTGCNNSDDAEKNDGDEKNEERSTEDDQEEEEEKRDTFREERRGKEGEGVDVLTSRVKDLETQVTTN